MSKRNYQAKTNQANNQLALVQRFETQIAKVEQQFKSQLMAISGAEQVAATYQREKYFALQAIKRNPYLLQCDPGSVEDAILRISMTGLSLDPSLKQAYLVPRKVKGVLMCLLEPSYQGMKTQAMNTGLFKGISAGFVFPSDKFDWWEGSDPKIVHKPDRTVKRVDADVAKVTHVYAEARTKDDYRYIRVLTIHDVNKRRAVSEAAKRNVGPWVPWPLEMMLKTGLRALCEQLPKTTLLQNLMNTYDASVTPEGITKDEQGLPDYAHPEVDQSEVVLRDQQGNVINTDGKETQQTVEEVKTQQDKPQSLW